MKYLVQYDQWCLSAMRATLLAIEEWLSLSQRRVERIMILTYVVSMIDFTKIRTAKLVAASLIAIIMWNGFHISTDQIRRLREHSVVLIGIRCAFQMTVVGMLPLLLLSVRIESSKVFTLISQIDYLLFLYATSISTNGDLGRRRKLAWSELKKMFGTDWIPKPVTSPS